MSYLTFVLKEKKLLSFGVSLTFFSSFGQTFLISLFVPLFLDAFTLTNAGFGSLYSVATLISAVTIPYLGQWIDKIPLRWYSLWVALGLFAASLLVMASWHIGILFLGIVLLRLSGQGLSSHTAETTMARFYDHERGKALSVSSLGYPLGEAVLPLVVASALTFMHWRTTWGFIALFIAMVLIPLLYFLVGRSKTGKINPRELTDSENRSTRENYSILYNDKRLYFLIPAVLIPPFWVTGLFLYQISLAPDLGWTTGLIATAFIFFALTRVSGALLIGPLIDRFSAKALFPFYLIPMVIAVLIPVFIQTGWSAFAYMSLLGVTMGLGGNIKSALWAELYGPDMIGTVRSLFSSFMVFSTALSPFLLGWLIDMNVPVENILISAVFTTIAAALLSMRIHPTFDSTNGS